MEGDMLPDSPTAPPPTPACEAYAACLHRPAGLQRPPLRRLGVLLISWLSAWVEVEAVRDVLSIPHYECLLLLCALIVGEVFAIGLRTR